MYPESITVDFKPFPEEGHAVEYRRVIQSRIILIPADNPELDPLPACAQCMEIVGKSDHWCKQCGARLDNPENQ